MSLYLCVFEGDEELDGVDVGSYEDFGRLRDVVLELEHGKRGSIFPTLMLHSDCDGEWTVDECKKLKAELSAISSALSARPPAGDMPVWQQEILVSLGTRPRNRAQEFVDVDGEPLIERIAGLCDQAIDSGQPILFQ